MVLGMASHPYYPLSLILDGYKAIDTPLSVLLGGPAIVGLLIVLIALILSGEQCRPLLSPGQSVSGRLPLMRLSAGGKQLSAAQRAQVCWFAFTGAVHMFIEGTLLPHNSVLAGTLPLAHAHRCLQATLC